MEKTVYITEEEREKCRKVIDVFEELYEIEDEDILLVDVGRYGFVKLQCYTASHGFEELDTYTDSNSLFEGLWEEWLSLNVFLLAREMQLADVLYDDFFSDLHTIISGCIPMLLSSFTECCVGFVFNSPDFPK